MKVKVIFIYIYIFKLANQNRVFLVNRNCSNIAYTLVAFVFSCFQLLLTGEYQYPLSLLYICPHTLTWFPSPPLSPSTHTKAMDKAKKSQMLKLFLIAAVLFITPLLSSSLRTTYLYFIIINLLIIALGAEAGLLSFSKPPQDKKYAVPVSAKPLSTPPDQAAPDKEASSNSTDTGVLLTTPERTEKKAKVVEKSASEKIVGAAKLSKVRKCPSTPSLFFIGGGEAEAEEAVGDIEEEDQEEVDGLSGQELFTKAETFIGNFYNQLKMQREESWKRLHEFYQKAF